MALLDSQIHLAQQARCNDAGNEQDTAHDHFSPVIQG